MLKLERELETLSFQLDEAEGALALSKSKQRDFSDSVRNFSDLAWSDDVATRTRLRQEIRRKVAQIDFWFFRDKQTPRLVSDAKNGLFPFARIEFANGKARFVVMVGGGFMPLKKL